MRFFRNWATSCVGRRLPMSPNPNVKDVARMCAEIDKGTNEVVGDNLDEIENEWRDFFEGDHVAELTQEEWATFAHEYAYYLGAGL